MEIKSNQSESKVKFEIINKELHDEVLKLVNSNRAKENKSQLTTLLPNKANPDDAKYDVYATSCVWDNDNDCWRYGTNLKLEPAAGQYLSFVPRSSNVKTEFYLPNTPSTGDKGYRGEYIFCFKPRTSAIVRKAINLFVQVISTICSITGLIQWRDRIKFIKVENTAPFKVGDRIVQMSREYVHDIVFQEAVLDPKETIRGENGYGSSGK